MRPLILALLIAVAQFTPAAAGTMPTLPPSTYPEPGTFCGLFTLCPKTAAPKDGG